MKITELRIIKNSEVNPADPLWKRVPARDADGRPLSDFMMIIPKLRSRSPQRIKEVVLKIEQVLAYYERHVVFADLNLNLNVLWVSLKPAPGMCLEVATAINLHVPDAKLVAQQIHA
ncbi:MAG: hypothetical protein AMJ53_08005 [Gammaproteobacteria bacterium SG8_11]|nr:MAG: hypothetical protein AMJ53_08005 [Gammaproteobacteria bacterium SG8_11]